jgi:uncharacterized protein involved in exopolysaccharide biosynthesis
MNEMGYPPYDWRINDIERKADAAAPKHEVASLRSDVDRLESALREVCAEVNGLRAQLETAQSALIQLQELVTKGIES